MAQSKMAREAEARTVLLIEPVPFRKPCTKFQDFWRLVRTMPDGPSETYHCTYLVDWTNQTMRNYEGPIENMQLLFKTSQERWDASPTCEAFMSQFCKLLGRDRKAKKVTKIVCFGLGDVNHKPPDWGRIENSSKLLVANTVSRHCHCWIVFA